MNRDTYTLYDSSTGPSYENYLLWCDNEDVVPTNDCYTEFISDSPNCDIDALYYGLDKYKHQPCVMFGVSTLQSEIKPLTPCKFNSLRDAVSSCFNMTEDILIVQHWGHIEVTAYLHDHTINHYQLWLLNDKGVETTKGDLSNSRYHKSMENLFVK